MKVLVKVMLAPAPIVTPASVLLAAVPPSKPLRSGVLQTRTASSSTSRIPSLSSSKSSTSATPSPSLSGPLAGQHSMTDTITGQQLAPGQASASVAS